MIMTKEIVLSEIQTLHKLINLADVLIDTHLTTLGYFIEYKFEQEKIDWAKGLVAKAQSEKERLQGEIEVKKSVLAFL